MAADPVIEQIEAQLRESRFKTWDVETFLADRHQAKIDALTAPADKWRQRGQVLREVTTAIAALVGYVAIVGTAGSWFLTGHLPFDRPAPIVINPIPPMPACPLPIQQ